MKKWTIIGLGNPGKEYERTRHNAGFLAMEMIRDKFGTSTWKKKLLANATTADADVDGTPATLVLPTTYMNESGKAVRKFVKASDEASRMIVLYDDVHIPLGDIKIKFGGGDAGHNGITSLTQHLKTKDFIRIRIGVGPIDKRPVRLADYVLEKFRPDERDLLEASLAKTPIIVADIIKLGLEEAMLKWHTK